MTQKQKKIAIWVGSIVVVLGGAAIAFYIWSQQEAEISAADHQKADEVAEDEELLNAIDAGLDSVLNATNVDTTSFVSDTVSLTIDSAVVD